mgnify:CR=1 FL=1
MRRELLTNLTKSFSKRFYVFLLFCIRGGGSLCCIGSSPDPALMTTADQTKNSPSFTGHHVVSFSSISVMKLGETHYDFPFFVLNIYNLVNITRCDKKEYCLRPKPEHQRVMWWQKNVHLWKSWKFKLILTLINGCLNLTHYRLLDSTSNILYDIVLFQSRSCNCKSP